MAQVIAKVLGGSPKNLTASTVGEVKTQLGITTPHAATVNGQTAEDNHTLNDNEFVMFSPSVKGGNI